MFFIIYKLRGEFMSKFWSKEIQSTELLYYSRKERFNDDNKDIWFNLLHIKENLKILEVGCGGGHFTNMINKYFPSCEVYGIDLDENNIKFAQEEAKRLELDVNYQVADIKKLPFEEEVFDIVFSHTVVEHLPFDDFISEQKRVLKENGMIIIMRVDMIKKNDSPFMFMEDEINEIYKVIPFHRTTVVGQYLEQPDLTMQKLNQYNFKDIKLNYNRIIFYMPDAEEDKEVSIRQIERNYQTKLFNAIFVINSSKTNTKVKNKLLNLLKRQYEERLKLLNSNKKIFDFQSTLLITICAKK